MKAFVQAHENEMIHNLSEFIRIPTVLGEEEEAAPLGREIRNGLLFLKGLAESMGLHTINHDFYVLEIQAGDLSAGPENSIGIICHMDVVAAGSGWTGDAFTPYISEGRLYGRGSVDDKGPVVACLYAMKYLMEQRLIPDGRRICMIVGTDEEENFQGIRYYAAHQRFPAFSFIPDGNFPLIYGEKGMLDFDLEYPFVPLPNARFRLAALFGGDGRNMVPSRAGCRITGRFTDLEKLQQRLREEAEQRQIRAEFDNQGNSGESGGSLSLCVKGKSAHSMSPEKGISAIDALMRLLAEVEELDAAVFVGLYNRTAGRGYYGEGLGIACSDTDSGPLTMNIGTIVLDSVFRMQANIRYPMTCPAEETCGEIRRRFAEAGFAFSQAEHLAPVNFRKEDPWLQKLLNAYRDVTGDRETEPITIGGATYTRFVPNSVAFGPIYADQEELAHEPDEYLEIVQLKTMTEIYEKALENLLL